MSRCFHHFGLLCISAGIVSVESLTVQKEAGGRALDEPGADVESTHSAKFGDHEQGSTSKFVINPSGPIDKSKACTTPIGKSKCTLPLGKTFKFTSNLNLKDPLRPTDVFVIGGQLVAKSKNFQEPMRSMVAGVPLNFSTRCVICGEHCTTSEYTGHGIEIHMVAPSAMDPLQCAMTVDGKHEAIFEHMNLPFAMKFSHDEGLRANFHFLLQIFNEKNETRVEDDAVVEMTAGAVSTLSDDSEGHHPWAKSRDWQEDPPDFGGLFGGPATYLIPGARQAKPAGGPGLFGALVRGIATGVRQDITEALAASTDSAGLSAAREDAGAINHLAFRARVKNLNHNGHPGNFTMKMNSLDCMSGPTCLMPAGTPFLMDMRMKWGEKFEEGSKMKMTCSTVMGGALGQLIKPFTGKARTITTDWCSNDGLAHSFVMYGQEVPYQPVRCGPYAWDITMPEFVMKLPDFNEITWGDLNIPEIPNFPKTLGAMPDMNLNCNFNVFNGDGSEVMNMDVSIGLK